MTTTEEQWRRSPSLPEYLVSNLGRVMRVPSYNPEPRIKGQRAHYGGKPWVGIDSGEGRMILVHEGKTYKVHRLICEAFNGPPEPWQVCIHIDEDYKNNRAENLKWGTQKENLNALGFIEYCKTRTGSNSPTIKARRKTIGG